MGSSPNWKAFFAAIASTDSLTLDERIELAKPVIAAVDGTLDGLLSAPNSSSKVYKALDIAYLNTTIQSLEAGKPEAYRTLVALNDVLTASTPRFAWCLVEHSFLNALVRLHQRVAKMDDPVAQAAVLVLCSITLLAGHAAGDNLEAVASRPEVCELVISQLIYLAVTPAVLLTAGGLGTAARCIQMCWELTRHPTPHCKGFRELLQRTDLAARLLVIATVAASGSPAAAAGAAEAAAGGEAASAAALVSAMASLEAGAGKAATGATSAAGASDGSSAGGPDDLFEERLALAAQATSLVANLAGLGTRGLELSAAGLAPQRAWLLRPGTLGLLRPVLDGLADGLAELRRRMEANASGSGSDSSSGSGEAERQEREKARLQALGPYGDLRPSTVSRRRLLDQAEGAVRNLLFLLGLPTVVMGSSEEDVVEACGFVIRHAFGMFTEGYVDTMRALRAAVAEPSAAASTSGRGAAFTSPYPGDYADFFRAFAGHVETVAPALGVQLEDWGVRFTGEQAARDLPTMQVGDGVDARIAQSWLKGQIQEIINWGHSVLNLVRMADQAKMSPQQRQQAQQQLQQQQAQQQAFPPVAAPHAYGGAAVSGGGSNCASCGAAPPAGNPPFQHCGKCRTVRYCSRACQVAHWPQHKPVCKPAAPAATADAASTPTPATAR
ncbi:hypothetical protein HYH02_000057 [Chlamydomonas schloesseri]|uniref:MYND-type domain-containing protein n=1 Tax=Chlamydomonas schloesseri TaxID=2026947 RepID=A0A835WLI4_9CHLO|nr:hypothetical protein HYH02_000057 [Chlamydomonas schloesseri]|eukprot:KAG2449953.1 hypothetical protein HYH02_000057 [Chlamydomonas schloesseri]